MQNKKHSAATYNHLCIIREFSSDTWSQHSAQAIKMVCTDELLE